MLDVLAANLIAEIVTGSCNFASSQRCTAGAGRRLTRRELAGAAAGPRRGHGFAASGARRRMGSAMGVSE